MFRPRDLPAIMKRLDLNWNSARQAILADDADTAETFLARVVQAKWDAGIINLPAHSMALLKLAVDAGNDDKKASLLLEYSKYLAPLHAGVALAHGRYYLTRKNLQPFRAIKEYFSLMPILGHDFEAIMHIMMTTGLCALATGFIGLLGFTLIVIAKYLGLFIHDVGDIFPTGFLPGWAMIIISLVLLFIPLIFGAPFWTLTIFWLLILCPYLKRGERIIAALLFISLLAAPFFFSLYTAALGYLEDNKLNSILSIRNGDYCNRDIEAILDGQDKDQLDLPSLLSLGLARKREGRFHQAAKFYAMARKMPSCQDVTYNNMGNLYLAAGQTEDAIRSYEKAMALNPERVEPVYNLSQAYYELLDFETQDRYYHKAEGIKEKRVAEFDRMKTAKSITRTVIDIPVPVGLLMDEARSSSKRLQDIKQGLWKESFQILDPQKFPLLGIAGLMILGIITLISQRMNPSYSCASCGQPICPKCNPKSNNPDLCMPCYLVFYGHGGMDPKLRTEKMISARRYRRLVKNLGWLLTIILPGSGHLFRGRPAGGFIFLVISCAILALVYSAEKLSFAAATTVASPGIAPGMIIKAAAYLLLIMVALIHYYFSMREEA